MAPSLRAEVDVSTALKEMEPRLRGIYERGEWRARRFGGAWLADSSGYTVTESLPGERGRKRVRYEIESGKRTVLETPQPDGDRGAEGGIRSPDGTRVLVRREGNLHVLDQESGESVALTKRSRGAPISWGKISWSPDGSRIAFVKSDHSQVRERSVLIPGDPSYPKVGRHRFA
ncbi:MAG: DPP IV N-terminal domain-containing protein, partial [Verrucomicrobiota bacterium]